MHAEFERLGVNVVGVVGQSRQGVESYVDAHPLPFPLIPDVERRVIKQYGVYHLIGLDALNMARPSTFLIKRNGEIGYIYVGNSQVDRPDPEELLAHAQKLLI